MKGLRFDQTLLLSYYDSSTVCKNELQSNWSIIGGGNTFPNNKCQDQCQLKSNHYTPFYLDPSQYPNGFEINKSIIEPSSVLGYDLVFYSSGTITIAIHDDSKVLDTQPFQYQTYDTFPQELVYVGFKCTGQTYQTIFVSKYILGYNSSTFRLQFLNMPSAYGFFKIHIWTNCVLNCSKCIDSKNCDTCLQGFTLMIMPSGQKVCSQQEGCQSSNCLECTKSENTEVCLICKPGYLLNNQNTCISNGNACSSGQYRDTDQTCQLFSNICLMEQSKDTWKTCNDVPDQTAINCPKNKLILLYQRGNYNTRVCGCNHLAFCDQCALNSCTKCLIGYNLNGSSCSFNNCPQDYQFNSITKLCDPQQCIDPQCLKCDSYICYQCSSSNFYIDSSNPQYCKECKASNCQKCNSDGTCKICKQGYYLSSGVCLSCFQSCMQCTDSQTCQQCINNYNLSADKTKCSCSDSNCQQCDPTDGSICEICLNGSFDSNSKTCKCLVQNCLQCYQNSNSSCQQCSGQYVKDNNNQCQCSIKNCSICNQIGDQCMTCQQGYQLQNANTQCICSVKYCLQCSSADGTQCEQCEQGYLNLSSTCQQQAQYCDIPFPTNGLKCQQCKKGFIIDLSNICQCGLLNCQQCNPNDGQKCDLCTQNYVANQDSTQCLCAVANCQQCNQNDGSICQSCIQGYVLQQNSTSCQQCKIANCLKCDSTNISQCNQCQSNYVNNLDSCSCTVKNCEICKPDDGQKCDLCLQNYQANSDSTQCLCAVPNCQQCSSSDGSICDICDKDFILSQNTKMCQQCQIANCLKCNPLNFSQCNECQLNYVNNLDSCDCTVKNCEICNPNDGQKCDLCLKNYLANSDSTQCLCTIPNCQQCSSSDGSICNICDKDFILSQNSKTCEECKIKNCLKCDSTNINQCNQCQSNYINNLDSCGCTVKNCEICNPNNGQKCDLCLKNFQANSDSTQCICPVPNCQQCSQSDGSICENCIQGYSLQYDTKMCEECKIANCLKCDPLNANQCNQCQKNYINNSDSCNCAVQNCQICNPNDGTICESCSSAFLLSEDKKECLCQIDSQQCQNNSKCSVQMCQECQKNQSDQCSICKDSYILTSDFKCSLQFQNDFSVLQSVYQNVGYNLTITFGSQIILNQEDIHQLLNLQIKNFEKPYIVNIQSIKDKQIVAQIQLKDNCKNKNLIIYFDNLEFQKINNIKEPQKEVQLQEYIKLSQSQISQAQKTAEATQGAASSLLIMMILMAIVGNTYVLFSTIDLTTFIYFLLFLEVRYPQNVLSFCSIFKNFQFAFIPNIIQVYFLQPNYVQPNTPLKFLENGYDAYFLNGAGQSFTIIIGILTIYASIKVLSYIPIPSVKVYIESKIKSGWEYCGFLDLIGCVYIYVLVSSLCQFYCFQFDEPLAFINYSLFAISFVFVFLAPIIMITFIKNCKNLCDTQIQQQFGSLIGGLVISKSLNNEKKNIRRIEQHQEELPKNKEYSYDKKQKSSKQQYLQQKWSKYTNVILYIRKIIYTITLLFIYGQVYLQMIIICLMNSFLAYFYLYIKPLQENSGNFKNGVSEVILIIMQVAVCFLVEDKEDQEEQERYNIGWLIIACASTILTIHIFNVVIDLTKSIYNLVKDFICTLLKPKSELEKLKKEKGQTQKLSNQSFAIFSKLSFQQILQKSQKVAPLFQLDTSKSIRNYQLQNNNTHQKDKEDHNNSCLVDFDVLHKHQNELSKQDRLINLDESTHFNVMDQYQQENHSQVSKEQFSKIQIQLSPSQSPQQFNNTESLLNSDVVLQKYCISLKY